MTPTRRPSNPLRRLASVTVVAIAGCASVTPAKHAPSNGPWAVRTRGTASSCELTEQFATPRRGDMAGTCMTTAHATERCLDPNGGPAIEKSPSTLTYLALAPKRGGECGALAVRDFFRDSVIDRDAAYLPILRRAAAILAREARRPSRAFLGFDARVRQALLDEGLSAAVAIHGHDSDSPSVVFDVDRPVGSIVLMFDTDGSHAQWTRVVE